MSQLQYPNRCCACGLNRLSRTFVMVDKKALTPGKGWGCVQCHLPSDGAIAAICDNCADAGVPDIQFVFDGYVSDGKLVPIGELPDVPHKHNMDLHLEIER